MDIPLQVTSQEIWGQKYQLHDSKQKPVDMCVADSYSRTSIAIAAQEKDPDYWEPKFNRVLHNGGTPAGRILSNAGAEKYKPAVSLINCTVSQTINDSMVGVLSSNLQAGVTLKAGCGIGYEFSTLRPNASFVGGAGAYTSGPLSFMNIFDSTCFTVSSAGGRRGAQMATFAVWHPDVMDFIVAKREDGTLRQFNLSLLIEDAFITAVRNNTDWQLVFPVMQKEVELDLLGDSETVWKDLFWGEAYCESEGYTMKNGRILCKVYKTIKAKKLWDVIMQSTYDFAEPGFLLIDRINKMNNNWFCEIIRATNPCLHPDSLIETVEGRVRIADITEPTQVYTMGEDGVLEIAVASASWISQKQAATINITTRNGKTIRVTPNHKVFIQDFGWKEAKDIMIGDRIVQLCRARRGAAYSGVKLTTENNRAYRMEHVMIAEATYGVSGDEYVHHIDGNTYNNCKDNLEVLSHSEHYSYITVNDNPQIHQVKNSSGKFISTSKSKKTIIPMPEDLRSNMKNNYSNVVVSIEEGETVDVYDMTVDGTHNFITDFMVVHNCGEQPLPPEGSCLLGSVNLALFILDPFTKEARFDWAKYIETVHVFSRMLDNVVELNGLPLEGQVREIEYKRRHGMGFLGLGSALSLLGITYGSEESLVFTEKVQKTMAIESYRIGISLAKEKGPAPIFLDYTKGVSNKVLWCQSKFLQQIWELEPQMKVDALEYGCRYTHATSIAPTGTIALSINNNVSNGIEPTFAHKYTRNVIQAGKKSKESVDVYSYEMLLYKHITGEEDVPVWFSTSDNVTPKAHVDIQAKAQKWCDSSISKTINVPTDMKFEDFKDIYMYAYDQGLKGCTTFRFNPEAFQGVLVKSEDLENTLYDFILEDGSTVTAKGNEMIIYDNEEHQANNLFDAIKEGYYGKF